MTDIWTSERAKAVFEKIGWPKGNAWTLMSGGYCLWHLGNLKAGEHTQMPDDIYAALCRDWCTSWMVTREIVSAAQGARSQIRDRPVLELIEWHLEQAANKPTGKDGGR